MNRTKLMAVSVIILMMAFGLMIGCQNNPVAPMEQSADTQVAYKTAQFEDGVEPIPLTAEHFGLAKTVGLRSHYGRVYKDYGGWLVAPGVVLRLPPDNDWKDRQILYFEVQLTDDPAELDADDDEDEENHGRNVGHIFEEGTNFAFNITLFDVKGNEVHINLDYDAWTNPGSLNELYSKDSEDSEDGEGTAQLYIHKMWLNQLLAGEYNLQKTDPYMLHIDPEEEEPDDNTVDINEEYVGWVKYDLPGFSSWGWIF